MNKSAKTFFCKPGHYFIMVIGLLLTFSSCSREGYDKFILGAGSTFGYPIYSKLFYEYNKITEVQTNYQSIGSGGGIKQLFAKTVDFGATDAFLTDKKIEDAGADIIQFPTCMGAVVISYNLPGVNDLKLTPKIIGDIYTGKIRKWNDPLIQSENAGVNLPPNEILVVHRSDGSGTTFIFTDYLTKVYPEWEKIGKGTSINWPIGIGGKGNEGVAGQIIQTPGTIGYIELVYAINNNMSYASVRNSSGNFIKPSLENTKAAAEIDLPADSRINISNPSSPNGYPISSFTWIILYKEQNYNDRSEQRAKELLKLMWWIIHEGQEYCEPMKYARLSDKAVKVAEDILKTATYNGRPILQ